ncbi:phosphate acyltransferase PlsX [Desulfohalobiaceae bacterium Ax17]|uniref:phosphate acyltransferase PlsX n=1 Tax=Desulfovulcanus ferrireducens TaxID=2831190 RepID=UPI00207BAA97|nr:phosphate acyltransferase PlsX [Desulfovulcanus ferrireducens]MBT8762699.1 phosphate acyltransferase PlsX [Desulfovulcanus ferrireducens]
MPKQTPCIAIDAMGGDHGPQVVIPGALKAARAERLSLILVGDEKILSQELKQHKTNGLDIEVVHAPEVAGMSEKPSEILRKKKNTSIEVAFRLVREGKAHGVVSAGNSGATLACGMFILGRIKGVERPALASIIPSEKGPTILIDVGANVDCKPYHLVQFGLMADVLARDVLHIEKPRVGILTIGEEEGKGNKLVREAVELFRMSSLNFIGNVEGRDIFTGKADIVVCDGFVGNIALKLMEGLAISLTKLLKAEVKKSFLARLGFLLGIRALKRFGRRIDYAEYGGAPLLGLRGIAIVCHGSSNSKAITNAVHMAATFIKNQANEHLVEGLSANRELSIFGKRALPRS